jgi:hypothetical protein
MKICNRYRKTLSRDKTADFNVDKRAPGLYVRQKKKTSDFC